VLQLLVACGVIKNKNLERKIKRKIDKGKLRGEEHLLGR
jgi:hypothetical protein